MKKRKDFDCVKMKRDIQQQIDREFAGVPDEKAHRIQSKRITRNPILGPYLREVLSSKEMALQEQDSRGK